MYISVYADDISLWVPGPKGEGKCIVQQLQAAMDAVGLKLASVGLQLSAAKTVAVFVHPDATARGWTRCLTIDREELRWKTWGSLWTTG